MCQFPSKLSFNVFSLVEFQFRMKFKNVILSFKLVILEDDVLKFPSVSILGLASYMNAFINHKNV